MHNYGCLQLKGTIIMVIFNRLPVEERLIQRAWQLLVCVIRLHLLDRGQRIGCH